MKNTIEEEAEISFVGKEAITLKEDGRGTNVLPAVTIGLTAIEGATILGIEGEENIGIWIAVGEKVLVDIMK